MRDRERANRHSDAASSGLRDPARTRTRSGSSSEGRQSTAGRWGQVLDLSSSRMSYEFLRVPAGQHFSFLVLISAPRITHHRYTHASTTGDNRRAAQARRASVHASVWGVGCGVWRVPWRVACSRVHVVIKQAFSVCKNKHTARLIDFYTQSVASHSWGHLRLKFIELSMGINSSKTKSFLLGSGDVMPKHPDNRQI